MSGLPSLPNPRTVFGKAFLAELGRGNIERAILFARAFLAQEIVFSIRVIDDRDVQLVVN